MDYNEFAEKIKIKYPQYKDMDNKDLAQRMVAKYPNTYDVSFDEAQQPIKASATKIDIRPSRILKEVPKVLSTPIIAARKGVGLKEAYQKADTASKKLEQERPILYGGIPALADFGVALALPMTKVKALGSLGNMALSGLYQGGVIGGLNSLAERGDLSGAGQGAALGAGLGGAIGAVPYVGKLAQPIGRASKWVTSKVTGINPKTIEQALKPESKALDLTEDTAQNLLMNTTERVRKDYADLLNKKGEKVQEALGNLKEDFSYPTNVLKGDVEKIYDTYSLSGNQDLNVARNEAGKVYNSVIELLEGSQAERQKAFNDVIENAKYPFNRLPDVTKHSYKNQFYTKSWDTPNNAIEEASRRFNDEILKEIKNNPSILGDINEIERLENKIAGFRAPEDFINELYSKFYKTIDEASTALAPKQRITPKELYDINRNISAKTQWDNPNAKIQNDILEQIYGKYAGRLGDISKDLKKANADYAALKDFEKNEGIRRILRPGDNLDTASSALKNYNSTITKGNTGRNVQDLENKLVENGYQPFLNEIDDVNAAQDLLTKLPTGINFLGVNNLLRGAANLGLRVGRKFKRNPAKLNTQNIGRYITPAAVEMMPLQGYVSYEDYGQ